MNLGDDGAGRSLTYAYGSDGWIDSITDPAGGGNGQPIDLSGEPGPNSATHIPRNGPGGDWPIPMG